MAGKAEESINPTQKLRIIVHSRLAWGISKLNGAAPKIEAQITYFRPIRSPTGPPINVPNQVESIITRETCHIDIFGENQNQQYRD